MTLETYSAQLIDTTTVAATLLERLNDDKHNLSVIADEAEALFDMSIIAYDKHGEPTDKVKGKGTVVLEHRLIRAWLEKGTVWVSVKSGIDNLCGYEYDNIGELIFDITADKGIFDQYEVQPRESYTAQWVIAERALRAADALK